MNLPVPDYLVVPSGHTTHEVAQNAEMAADAAGHTEKETAQSQNIVNTALEGIDLLGNDIGQSSELIVQLDQEINEISTVVEMIGHITEQTNLLALNAAIEAARAGEQGRGISVVADEVRSLADKTRLSTDEIRNKIEMLQQSANTAVKEMENNRETANNVVQSANVARTSLESISTSVTKISDMTRAIATAAEEQSAVAKDVNQRVEEISSLAGEVDQSFKNISAGSEGIEALSMSLGALVGRFKY